MDLRSSKKGVTITVNIFETLGLASSNKLHKDHLFKQLRGSPIIDYGAIAHFWLEWNGYNTHQLPQNSIFSPEQSSLHSAAEVGRALDSGMKVPVQVGNNILVINVTTKQHQEWIYNPMSSMCICAWRCLISMRSMWIKSNTEDPFNDSF